MIPRRRQTAARAGWRHRHRGQGPQVKGVVGGEGRHQGPRTSASSTATDIDCKIDGFVPSRIRQRSDRDSSTSDPSPEKPGPSGPDGIQRWPCSAAYVAPSACATREHEKFDIKLVLERLLLRRHRGQKACATGIATRALRRRCTRRRQADRDPARASPAGNSRRRPLVVDARPPATPRRHVDTFVFHQRRLRPLVSRNCGTPSG